MKVRIDFVKEELIKDIWTRSDVALQLVACAICLKFRQDKKGNRREAIVVGIDVHYPAIPAHLIHI